MSDGHVYATRKFTFSAAHRYGRPEWSESENRRVFGHLTVSHGHNYVLEVTIRGAVDEQTGMVMDLAELKRVVADAIIQRFDHADLNADPLFAPGTIPTTENLVRAAWDLLAPQAWTGASVAPAALGGSDLLRGVFRRVSALELTRQYHFSAGHRLANPALSSHENERGSTASAIRQHGHNYLIEVTVAGELDPVTGMSADLGALDAAVKRVSPGSRGPLRSLERRARASRA